MLTTARSGDGKIHIDLETASECIQKRVVRYDKTGDQHYDTISAFIKSMRGSDPDAAIYYLAKMLYAGEDIRFISRRIMICAAEDVGMADPQALVVASAAAQAVERIGMPEAQIILAEAVAYVACAPKSNASYMALNEAMESVRQKKTTCRPICRTPITREPQNWDMGWDINTPTIIPTIMWTSSTFQRSWRESAFTIPQRMDMSGR